MMSFEDFSKLASGDRVTLLTALEILFQTGNVYVIETDSDALVSAIKKGSGNLFADNMLTAVVNTAKELAQLRTCKLLSYVKRSCLDFKRPDAPEHGVCPICGCGLKYTENVVLEDTGYFRWTCPDCGAAGKEGYNIVFTRHYDVRDGDGKPFSFPTE